jgi:uncharacterized membrane protein YjjP (DUF1212 family)
MIEPNAGPRPDAPKSQAHAVDPAELLQFLTQLGVAMAVAGEATSLIRRSLQTIAAAYGQPVRSVELPTIILIETGDAGATRIAIAGAVGQSYRFDQIAEVYAVLNEAERGMIAPADGLARLHALRSRPPRFGAAVRVVGHSLLTVGLGLILNPQPDALAVCALLGLLVGVLRTLRPVRVALGALLPVSSSIVVAVAVFALVKAGLVESSAFLLIPPLITFLPGGLLTTAMLELTVGDMVSGASRIVLGAVQLLLLFFGLAVGAQFVNLPLEVAFAPDTGGIWSTWASVVGVLLFGVGIYLHFCGPKGSLHWLWLALLVAWAGQALGSRLVGGYLGGFIGAVVMTPVVYLIARQPSGPPTHVTFLPAFWLLVPGALGLIGLTNLAGGNRDQALATLGETALSVVAIALGVLVGLSIVELTGPLLRTSAAEQNDAPLRGPE